MEQYQMSSETRTLEYGEPFVQYNAVISWQFVPCRFKIAPGYHSFYYERLHIDKHQEQIRLDCRSNLLDFLLEFRQAEHRATHAKT